MHTQAFDQSDGLSSTQITDFYQDSRGIIWLGTSYGLNSYNGAEFKSYKKENGLAHNYILEISEDNLGNLWIRSGDFSASKYFITIYLADSDTFSSLENYIGSDYPFNGGDIKVHKQTLGSNIICEKFDGKHWFYELKNKKVHKLFNVPFEEDKIPSLIHARRFDDNIYRFIFFKILDGNNLLGLQYEYDLKASQLTQLDINAYTNIQWSSFDQEIEMIQDLEKFDSLLSKLGNTKYIANNIATRQYSNFQTFENQLVLLNRKDLKLLHYDLKSIELVKEFPIMGDFLEYNLNQFYMDQQGGYWFHGEENLVRLHFEQNKFHVVRDDSKIGAFSIRGIAKVNEEINFACLYGICKESNGELRYKNLFQQFPIEASSTTGFAQDRDVLWIASEVSGLLKYDIQSGDVKHYPFADDKSSFLWQPFVDSKGQVWIGSEGLYKLDMVNEVILVGSKGGLVQLQESTIYSFHNAEEGTWICTNTGLYLVDLDSETIIHQYNKDAEKEHFLPLEGCVHLHRDKEDIFWIATKGAGLVKWDPSTGKYQSFTKTTSELTHNILYAVYEDDFSNLWLPSHYGLMKFNKLTNEVNTYYKTDGLAHNEFNTTSHFQDDEGNLYFGTLNGLVQFNPSEFDHKNVPNPILLTNAVRLNNKLELENILGDFKYNHSLEITSKDRYIELDFSLVNFNKNSPNKYSYRIDGFQEEWIYSDKGLIRLEALPYGTYSLEVRGKPSHTSKWSSYDYDISIVVKRPIYLQWWFILLTALLIGVLFYCAVRWNTHKILERQKELELVVLERTEEIRFQAEELKLLDKVKNNFFANISHELRTPLTLILGPLSYIIDNPERLDDKKVQKQLLVMQRNGTNLLHLIGEILDLSKLQANKLELDEEVINVTEFFEYLFNKFEPQFENTGIKATLKNAIESNLSILMDRKKMEKVLNNFLSNSIKYTPRGGSIDLTLNKQNDILVIKVKDSGSGITEADMPYIFDRFFQSNQADKKRNGGAGIGLALVKEFATLMNAKVYAESKIGEGSQFSFELPIKEKNVSISPINSCGEEKTFIEEDLVPNNDSFNILVAEDNADMRDFICGLLSPTYKTVIPASNGAEAWKILKERQADIHLVVSDIMMPEVDGLELVKKAKEDKKLSTIPFMMLTALAAERDKLAALTIGVDDYLTKPFSVPELLARINNMLINASMRKAWWSKLEVSVETSKSTNGVAEDFRLSEKDKLFIEELKRYIESNPTKEELDLKALAKRFLLSLRHLNRKVNQITGLPPAKFVREVQLQKARQILEDGNFESISEVAYSVGFYQPSTFTALFKKRFGTTPSKYRNKHDSNFSSSSKKKDGM